MAIAFTSDWHIKKDNPIARTDNYFDTLMRKLTWIREQIGDMPMIVAGDIYDTGKPQSFLSTYSEVKGKLSNTYTIPGNHDLSYKNVEYMPETAYGAMASITGMHLEEDTLIDGYTIVPYSFGEPIVHRTDIEGPSIAVTHQFVWDKKPPFDLGVSADYLLTEFPEYDIILSGDNHKHFVITQGERMLINPGSLMRMDADQIDYQPQLIILDNGKLEFIPIPIEPVVSRAHIDNAADREFSKDAMLAYLELVKEADQEIYDFLPALKRAARGLPKDEKNLVMELYTELKDDA